jgi:hypothetical protein
MKKKKNETLLWDWYNNLLLSGDLSRVRKLLVRYELFKKSLKVPGDIIECGVFKGVGLMYWLKLLKIFANGEDKRVIGFDTFSKFSSQLKNYEKNSAKKYIKESKFKGVDHKKLLSTIEQNGFDNCVLVKGEINNTISNFLTKNRGLRISLLNIDFDTYAGTKTVLEKLYNRVSRGGIIVLDEYGKSGWGESDAVDEFFKNKKNKIHSVRYSGQPTAYIIK